ncbi:LPS export ABC transporter permease LptF [Thorsellia anophelis]|uniref:Lipopolysaccharide export system permease protein LptF n=1 Tax=Thorsellia anophelis DSM 18579 TaxID=1123402 RepID=A0A1H9YPM7_9GAMM|nr:LPS export ABC transporter permease LptF [Thorsellia anophelis]SES70434.1 lipopolysaccharide export system permease protein [Thorsellia anophelis DSM 18579]
MIIIRYLTKEIFKTQISILFILLLIFFSQSMIRILGSAVEGQVSADIILPLLGLGVPDMAQLILPLSLFLALLMTLGRMHTESEITVMYACGISPRRILASASILAILTGGLALLNVSYFLPWSAQYKTEIVENARANPSLAAIIEGQFQSTPDRSAVIYVGSIKGQSFENVFLAQLNQVNNRKPSIVVANSGKLVKHPDGSQEVILTEGTRYEGTARTPEFRITHFNQYQAIIGQNDVDNQKAQDSLQIDELSFWDLLDKEDPNAKAELHWRLTLIAAVFLMALIVIPLSEVNPRQGRVVSMLPAVLLYLIYFLAQSSIKTNSAKGLIDPLIWVWGLNLFYLIIGIILNSRNSRFFRQIGIAIGVIK